MGDGHHKAKKKERRINPKILRCRRVLIWFALMILSVAFSSILEWIPELFNESAAEFAVADIEDIKWSSLPFNSLSISNEQRDIIMALIEARNGPSAIDEVVAGKRKGLNILL
jgi:hypothetical protein